MIQFEYRDLMWILGVGIAVTGALVGFIKIKLSGGDGFARASDVATLSAKVSSLEQSVLQRPSHEDIRALQARVGVVETSVAVVGEKVGSVKEITVRVEHQLNIIAQSLAREAR